MEKSQNQNISIVQVFPDPLVITQTGNSNNYESKLNLTNLTNEYVVFKIYSNQQALYSAKPSTSFIPPKETAYVSIKRFKKDEEQTKVGKDKFLLVFYTINKVINDNDEARDAIKLKLYNENSKQDTVISIILKNKQEDLELTYTYNENNMEDIGNDYNKGIMNYTELNENIRGKSNRINQKIKNLKNDLSMIKKQNELKNEKDIAMKDNKNVYKSEEKKFIKIILISIVLLGLLIGCKSLLRI